MNYNLRIATIVLTSMALSISPAVFASASKPVAKVDCTQKKNAKKLECKEAPKSSVKPAVKKPEKVDRKAPKSVQQKAAEKKN